jgi:protein-disulfide isomerase-like protein with CxxC motif
VTRYQLGAVLTPGAAFATSTIAYLASGAVLFAQVAELRSRVRTLSVVRIAGYTDDRSAAMFVELKSLVAALGLADSQRARGQSSSADHEATWWRAYDRLGQNHPGPATC